MKPKPPRWLMESIHAAFAPAPEIGDFALETFLNEESKLFNADHVHLRHAKIGYLWTNTACVKQMNRVVAQVTLPKPPTMAGAWEKARFRFQLRQWFGRDDLDFLITFDAGYMATCEKINYLATIDHELYHCAQKRDEFGAPKFNSATGLPVFGLRGHDVEEFVGIVERYGVNAGAGMTKEFVAAARRKPLIGKAQINAACGNCV